MRGSKLWIILIITIAFLWVDTPPVFAVEYKDIENVMFVDNYDGDTITVIIEGWPDIIGNMMPIRVEGVDTPERRAKCKNEKLMAFIAKRFVYSELMNAKNIKILNPKRGKYFRIVGDVEYDGKLLSMELLKKEYAYPYEGGTKQNPWCENTP